MRRLLPTEQALQLILEGEYNSNSADLSLRSSSPHWPLAYLALNRRKLLAISGKLKAGRLASAPACLSADVDSSSTSSAGMTCWRSLKHGQYQIDARDTRRCVAKVRHRGSDLLCKQFILQRAATAGGGASVTRRSFSGGSVVLLPDGDYGNGLIAVDDGVLGVFIHGEMPGPGRYTRRGEERRGKRGLSGGGDEGREAQAGGGP